MLHIHFTVADVARVRVLPAADPLWEIVLSNFLLRDRQKPVVLRPWMQRLRRDHARLERVRPGARLLAGLAPQGPYFPDFLTPTEAIDGLEAGLVTIATTPRGRLNCELALLAATRRLRGRPTPSWLHGFTAGDKATMIQLTGTLRTYYEAAIAPHDDLIMATIATDVAYRTRMMRDGGAEGLFRSFGPLMSWQPPVLRIQYDVDQDLHLNGRGLRFVPSYFCYGSPVSLANPDLTPVVIYPIPAQHRWGAISKGNSLDKLLGATRAAVLTCVESGASTTDLARVLSTSPATVSRHTAVLRDAGLLITHRHYNIALHSLTPLGKQLLGDCAPQ